MANFLFNKFKEDCLRERGTDIDMDSGTNNTKVRPYHSADMTPSETWQSFSTNAPTFYNSGAVAGVVITGEAFGSGVYDGDQVVFPSVAADGTKQITGLIIYEDGGTDATRYYIAHFDSFTSILPDGNDIRVAWDGDGIFSF